MAEGKIFVGREAELEQFKEVLKGPKGQAVLVVGQAGMGKTWLVNKMAEIAENHPELKCGWVRYEVTKEDSVDSRLAIMIDDAFEAVSNPKKFWGGGDRGKKQWVALYKVLEAIPSAGKVFEAIRGLAKSLKRDISKDSRNQFVEKIKIISKKMPTNGRAIFIVDPEKYMRPGSDEAWSIVVKQLPEKTKFVFAQRPEDELVKGRAFKGLKNICYIPDGRLGALKESDVGELVRLRANDVGQSGDVLKKAVKRYKGHPYAIVGALDIVKKTRSVDNLPQDPTPEAIAEAQWERICDSGNQGINLFEVYAVLEVGVPDDVVQKVSGLNATTRKRLQNDSYLRGLLRQEGEGKRIYHAILADFILDQIGDAEKKQYHSRAVEVYRGKLARAKKEQIRPDALAAMRLAEHVLAAEGEEAFVYAVLNEAGKVLMNLGLLDTSESSLLRVLEIVNVSSREEAMVTGNLGLIYEMRGALDKAEEMFKKSLEISEPREMLVLTMNQYANLGNVYYMRGELDKAEEMYRKSLEIAEKLGLQGGRASDYGNLGLIYEMRGDLDKAEEMHKKALEIDKKIGRLEEQAIRYGNLGLIYTRRGELDKAEEMHLKALKIKQKFGLQEGIANSYANLGSVYKQRGGIGKAREYWVKAVELYKRIGMPHMVEKVQGWIDGLKDKKGS